MERREFISLLAMTAAAGGAGVSSRTSTANAAAEEKKIKIGFLPGVVDPFYQVMQLGVETATRHLGIEVVTQIPQTWGVEAQTPILDSMVARGDLNCIIVAPTDKDQMIGPLKNAADAGIRIITVDTFSWRWRLRCGAGQVSDQLYRLGQCRRRAHLRAGTGKGDRWQGPRLHQLHEPECQLGRRP